MTEPKKPTLTIEESNALWVDAFGTLAKFNTRQSIIVELIEEVKETGQHILFPVGIADRVDAVGTQTTIKELIQRVKNTDGGAYRRDVPPLHPDNGLTPMFGLDCTICGYSSIIGGWKDTCPHCHGTIDWDLK